MSNTFKIYALIFIFAFLGSWLCIFIVNLLEVKDKCNPDCIVKDYIYSTPCEAKQEVPLDQFTIRSKQDLDCLTSILLVRHEPTQVSYVVLTHPRGVAITKAE
jgi:hypothetical protein